MKIQTKDIFKDKDGKVVLWQSPSGLLWTWIGLKVILLLIDGGQLKSGLQQLSSSVLFVWAFLEITEGVNYFRRLLGFIVLALTIFSYFKK